MKYIRLLKILEVATTILTFFMIYNFHDYGLSGVIGLVLSVAFLSSLAWVIGFEEGIKKEKENKNENTKNHN